MWISLGILVIIVLYFFLSRLIRGKQVREKRPSVWQNLASLLIIFLVIFILFVVILRDSVSSILINILLVSLIFTMTMNFLTVPLAIFHKLKQKRKSFNLQLTSRGSVLLCLHTTKKKCGTDPRNLVEADYDNKEIIVVDDGSEDSTSAPSIHAVGLRW